jgi:deoxyribonuclease-4
VDTAPARGLAIGATAIQVFTKTPNQWREPALSGETCTAFRRAVAKSGLRGIVAHDSYLINLASPDPLVSLRSIGAFKAELERCRALKIRYLVSHPGNYIDDRDLGLSRNAAAYAICLEAVPGRVMVLLETTAGTGTALGSSFEELAELRARIPAPLRRRIGFCADTCHLYAAGYDLVRDFDGVWDHWERVIGLRRLRCMHLNDSKTPFGARRDRHELIGEGTLGPAPFRRVMTDPRFESVIKILETPKGNDGNRMDRKMLRRLRGYGRSPGRGRSVA